MFEQKIIKKSHMQIKTYAFYHHQIIRAALAGCATTQEASADHSSIQWHGIKTQWKHNPTAHARHRDYHVPVRNKAMWDKRHSERRLSDAADPQVYSAPRDSGSGLQFISA
jgi:hypothetical protein